MFAILDEQTRLATGSAQAFVSIMNENLKDSDLYTPCEGKETMFGIRHFAGQVSTKWKSYFSNLCLEGCDSTVEVIVIRVSQNDVRGNYTDTAKNSVEYFFFHNLNFH